MRYVLALAILGTALAVSAPTALAAKGEGVDRDRADRLPQPAPRVTLVLTTGAVSAGPSAQSWWIQMRNDNQERSRR